MQDRETTCESHQDVVIRGAPAMCAAATGSRWDAKAAYGDQCSSHGVPEDGDTCGDAATAVTCLGIER